MVWLLAKVDAAWLQGFPHEVRRRLGEPPVRLPGMMNGEPVLCRRC